MKICNPTNNYQCICLTPLLSQKTHFRLFEPFWNCCKRLWAAEQIQITARHISSFEQISNVNFSSSFVKNKLLNPTFRSNIMKSQWEKQMNKSKKVIRLHRSPEMLHIFTITIYKRHNHSNWVLREKSTLDKRSFSFFSLYKRDHHLRRGTFLDSLIKIEITTFKSLFISFFFMLPHGPHAHKTSIKTRKSINGKHIIFRHY